MPLASYDISINFSHSPTLLFFLFLFIECAGVCLICRLLGAELPHPNLAVRLRTEKGTRHNDSLNRTAVGEMRTSVLRLTGIHQV